MNQNAIRSGLIIGVIGIIIGLLLYLVDPTSYGIWWLMIIFGILNLVLITVFGVKYRNEIGGFIGFKDAYIWSLITMIVMVVLSTIFSYLLFNVIDPGMPEIVADAGVENAEAMARRFGAPEEGMEEVLEKARQDTLDRFTLVGMLKGAGFRILVNLVFCLILAAIIKKNEPEEAI